MTVLRVPCDKASPKLLRDCTRSPRGFHGADSSIQARFVGVELYFENVERAKKFYIETVGLEVSDEQVGDHAKFDSGAGFVCLERKGAESAPASAASRRLEMPIVWLGAQP